LGESRMLGDERGGSTEDCFASRHAV
jgi:hypothetical protein